MKELFTTKYKLCGIPYVKRVKHVFKTKTKHPIYKGHIEELFVFGLLVRKTAVTRQTF